MSSTYAPKAFTLTIDLGNDAMQREEDIARALRRIADRIDGGATDGAVMDDNGNKVGSWVVDYEV
jgi:hypothetical protein